MAVQLPQIHWRTACEALFQEEYDWVLLYHDFRGEDFVVTGLGAATSGWTRLVKALPSEQIIICFIRPAEIREQPFLLIYSPAGAPFRQVTTLDVVKEKFWLPFLSGGLRCASKTKVVHTIREVCDAIDPTLWELIQEPEPEKPPQANVDNLLSSLDAVTKGTDAVVIPEPQPIVEARDPDHEPQPTVSPPSTFQPVDNRPVRLPPPDQKKGCCAVL